MRPDKPQRAPLIATRLAVSCRRSTANFAGAFAGVVKGEGPICRRVRALQTAARLAAVPRPQS